MRIGVRSSAILLGRYDVAGVMASQALFLGIMACVGWEERLRLPYYAGLVVAAAAWFVVRKRSNRLRPRVDDSPR